MPSKKRCQLTQNETRCNQAALRLVGECPHCSNHYCGQHRLPEQHACSKLQDCKTQAFEQNKEKLMQERTVSSKMVTV